jgi:monofunctional biosynthetic peptidoglycan transglycosylase
MLRLANVRVPPRRKPRLLRAVFFVVLTVLLAPYLIAPFYTYGEPVSTLMLWRRLAGQPVERVYVPLSKVSPALTLAVLTAEDARFCDHYGVDFTELGNAIADADGLEDMRGGSTISQQLAKNLFLWQGRSYVRKVLEFPLALWIDLVLSKRRILEIYLNVAELGPNGIFGAEVGSRRAFGKSAQHLTGYEAALLAASLPNPNDRNARAPGPGLRRLAGLYVARAGKAPQVNDCVRRTP